MNHKLGAIALLIGCVLLNGCGADDTNNKPTEPNKGDSASNTVTNRPSENQAKPIEKGPGPLTKENTSIGGIRIGDTQEQVKSLLGEPTKITNGGGGTPEVEWYYEKQNTRILFYRNSENEPIGGVENILLASPSTLKTDKNIGIGDSAEQLMKSYKKIETDGKKTLGYWVTGANHTEGVYHPYLLFLMDDNNRIKNIQLSNHFIDPAKTK
ncbi:hypothetical protein [Paenibacillus ehimensis]|uniref:Lipoprotein SmpA/OmlA domain-containing protein n=1 Tax=Paenibacillus ehimensis TaxID=79264 RepID=A0ABT8VCB9_9BACL|nr:hypothetical protein [Paenibacillus ehimensis]MDO3678631.1 hypothetical protein [Paenibacillus ehimensis]